MVRVICLVWVVLSTGCATTWDLFTPYSNYVYSTPPAKVHLNQQPFGVTPLGLQLDGHGPSNLELSVSKVGFSPATVILHKKLDPTFILNFFIWSNGLGLFFGTLLTIIDYQTGSMFEYAPTIVDFKLESRQNLYSKRRRKSPEERGPL